MPLITVSLLNKSTLLLVVIFVFLSGCSGTGHRDSSPKVVDKISSPHSQSAIEKAKQEAEQAAEKAKQEAEQAAAEKAKQEAEQAATEKAKQEAESITKPRYTKKWNIQRSKNKANKRQNNKAALNRTSTGTGFFVSKDGFLLTNEHVVRGAKSIGVYLGSIELNAELIELDINNDVALLKVDSSSLPLPFSLEKQVHIGEDVAVIGFPNISVQGNNQKATFGYINSLFGIQNDERYFQISSPIQPGNSGSPLISSEGSVIGIVTSTLNQQKAFLESGFIAQNVNYALKIPKAIELLRRNNVQYITKNNTSETLSKKELIKMTQDSVLLILAYR